MLDLRIHLKKMYQKNETSHENNSGYAAKNIFTLICHIPNNLVGNSLYNYKILQLQDK